MRRFVDHLLESPHYGERWGRHWLDLARYADSNGYNADGERKIWMYREWLIRALNRDLPFDQFVIEQIAGDMLPNASEDQIVATGFHRNTLLNLEGGVDFEQYRVEAVVDRVDTTGVVFLGLTLGLRPLSRSQVRRGVPAGVLQLLFFLRQHRRVERRLRQRRRTRPRL